MEKKNLLKETLETLWQHGKTSKEVEWCGTKNSWCTWDEFAAVADVEYDSGYGIAEVADDLVIVGKDW